MRLLAISFPKASLSAKAAPLTAVWCTCRNISKIARIIPSATHFSLTRPVAPIPTAITVRGTGNAVQHEASVSQVSAEQIFYMQQRGLTEAQAMSLSVNGFVNDLVRQFPMEYSVELKRLIELEMEGSVG